MMLNKDITTKHLEHLLGSVAMNISVLEKSRWGSTLVQLIMLT